MYQLITPLIVCLLAGSASSQYEQERRGFQQNNQSPANILLHKQALGQDGSFNYAFAADNGLQQGEVINPDGSRKGSYSYVDPNGKTVSLSYTAGKDGFRVLNGDHLPKAPDPQQQRPNPRYYPQQPLPYSQPPPHQQSPNYPLFRPEPIPYEAYRNAPNAPAYRGHPAPQEAYSHPPPPPPSPQYRPASHHQAPYRHPPPTPHLLPTPNHRPRQYSVEEGGYDNPKPYMAQPFNGDYYQEEPRRPHSFGNGYSFEFAG